MHPTRSHTLDKPRVPQTAHPPHSTSPRASAIPQVKQPHHVFQMTLSISSAILFFAMGSQAVDVINYGSRNCGVQQIGGCRGLAANTCCTFTDTYRTLEGVPIVSGTGSVEWLNLQQCDVGSWFYPRVSGTASGCGRVKGSAVGPARRTCMSEPGTPRRRDGAMW